MSRPSLIYILWEDSSSIRGWTRVEDPDHAPVVIESIGWFIRDAKDMILITTSISPHGSCMDALAIPKCSIIKQKVLKCPTSVAKLRPN